MYVATYCVIVGVAAQKREAPTKAQTSLMRILRDYSRTRKLAPTDRNMITQVLNSSDDGAAALAITVLHGLMVDHQYSLPQYKAAVEARVKRAVPIWAWELSDTYPHASVGRGGLRDIPLAARQGKCDHPKVFSPEDAKFCTNVLNQSSEAARTVCAGLIVSRRGLSPSSRSWILAAVDAQIGKKSPDKEFWQFVKRVVVYRNPVSKRSGHWR